jgi:hypothetical protein
MTRRESFHVGALLLIPISCFVVTTMVLKDSYLSITVSYMALLVVARFVDLDAFVLLPPMKVLRKTHNGTIHKFVFQSGSVAGNPPTIETTPDVILSDRYMATAAKLDYLVAETARAVNGVREKMIEILFLNIFLIVFLIILTPAQPTPVAAGNQPITVVASTAVQSAGPIGPQARMIFSYVAVAFQLLWIGQLLFHYRQRNVEAYTQSELSESETAVSSSSGVVS